MSVRACGMVPAGGSVLGLARWRLTQARTQRVAREDAVVRAHLHDDSAAHLLRLLKERFVDELVLSDMAHKAPCPPNSSETPRCRPHRLHHPHAFRAVVRHEARVLARLVFGASDRPPAVPRPRLIAERPGHAQKQRQQPRAHLPPGVRRRAQMQGGRSTGKDWGARPGAGARAFSFPPRARLSAALRPPSAAACPSTGSACSCSRRASSGGGRTAGA